MNNPPADREPGNRENVDCTIAARQIVNEGIRARIINGQEGVLGAMRDKAEKLGYRFRAENDFGHLTTDDGVIIIPLVGREVVHYGSVFEHPEVDDGNRDWNLDRPAFLPSEVSEVRPGLLVNGTSSSQLWLDFFSQEGKANQLSLLRNIRGNISPFFLADHYDRCLSHANDHFIRKQFKIALSWNAAFDFKLYDPTEQLELLDSIIAKQHIFFPFARDLSSLEERYFAGANNAEVRSKVESLFVKINENNELKKKQLGNVLVDRLQAFVNCTAARPTSFYEGLDIEDIDTVLILVEVLHKNLDKLSYAKLARCFSYLNEFGKLDDEKDTGIAGLYGMDRLTSHEEVLAFRIAVIDKLLSFRPSNPPDIEELKIFYKNFLSTMGFFASSDKGICTPGNVHRSPFTVQYPTSKDLVEQVKNVPVLKNYLLQLKIKLVSGDVLPITESPPSLWERVLKLEERRDMETELDIMEPQGKSIEYIKRKMATSLALAAAAAINLGVLVGPPAYNLYSTFAGDGSTHVDKSKPVSSSKAKSVSTAKPKSTSTSRPTAKPKASVTPKAPLKK